MPRSHKIPTDSLSHALVKYEGDYQAVADHFDVQREYIWKRVQRDPKLRAVWIKNGTAEPLPDSIEVMEREESPEDKNERMLKALKKNGRDAFENDVKGMLSNPDNVKKLDVFKDFDDSIGMLMAEALRVTQKLNIRQNLSLFEVTEQLKEELQDETMDIEEKALKTQLLIQIIQR